MTNFELIDIHELLPQQEPFVMVGRLVHYDSELTVTETEIDQENIFTEDGVFTQSGVIENIAQTCAARIGYINKYILKKGIQLGFIGSIRNMVIHRCPKAGETIRTEMRTIEDIFGMMLVSARVSAGDETIAETEMKIALSQIMSQSN